MSLLDWVKANRKNVLDWWIPQPVVFHHVPKCGGTSVGRALRKRYVLSQSGIERDPGFDMVRALYGERSSSEVWSDVCRFREEFLIYQLYCGTRCVSAHVTFSRKAYDMFHQRYKFITVLREPVSRFISNYRHMIRRGRMDLSLREYLETHKARYDAVRYVEYLCGDRKLDIYSQGAVDAAVENLDCFAVVGSTEAMPKFAADVSQALSIRLSIGHENRGEGQQELSQELVELMPRIQELCAADSIIYAAAQNCMQRS